MALPDEAYLLAMASIPDVGPAAIRAALVDRAPAEAWERLAVRAGAPRAVEPIWSRHLAAGVTVVAESHPDYPAVLRDDPAPPAFLVCRGDLGALGHRRVGVVGTRRASQYGLGVAERLGAWLASAGVAVVSGLALGVDGAAHRGLLSTDAAPPVGVVACGLDVVYPPRHRGLWREVAERGLLVSERPLGQRPTRWSFPARNRIIAGLSELVVVVESKATGGSLYTAQAAIDRGIPVMAVPGPITSAVARGTNRLIADGAAPLCDLQDLEVALGLVSPTSGSTPGPEPGGVPGRVLDACAHESVTLETLLFRTGLTLPETATAIDELCRTGWLAESNGRYERTTPHPRG